MSTRNRHVAWFDYDYWTKPPALRTLARKSSVSSLTTIRLWSDNFKNRTPFWINSWKASFNPDKGLFEIILQYENNMPKYFVSLKF